MWRPFVVLPAVVLVAVFVNGITGLAGTLTAPGLPPAFARLGLALFSGLTATAFGILPFAARAFAIRAAKFPGIVVPPFVAFGAILLTAPLKLCGPAFRALIPAISLSIEVVMVPHVKSISFRIPYRPSFQP